jgi:hypothetical protein
MLTNEQVMDQIDTCRMTMEAISKASTYFDKIDPPIHRSFFNVKAKFYDLLNALSEYELSVEHLSNKGEDE